MLTTHYMEEADKLCDRVAIMDHGKILALDTPDALKRSVGADTIVTVKAEGDGAILADTFTAASRASPGPAPSPVVWSCTSRAPNVSCPASLPQPRPGRDPGRPVGRRTHARNRIHRIDREGARLMATSTTDSAESVQHLRFEPRLTRPHSVRHVGKLHRAAGTILRDLVVLWKHKIEFVVRTLVQPFLLCFVFLYVFPKIGQGIGGSSGIPGAESAFATVLVPGVVGLSIMFQGIQAVAMQLAQEFGFTREIEDRVQAPCPIWLVAISKVISGGTQGIISAVLVLPIASVVHASGVEAHINLHWLFILTIVPLSCLAMTSLGLLLGTSFEPRNLGLMFGFIVLPITFWRHLLPVDTAGSGQGGWVALAADGRTDQPAHLRE